SNSIKRRFPWSLITSHRSARTPAFSQQSAGLEPSRCEVISSPVRALQHCFVFPAKRAAPRPPIPPAWYLLIPTVPRVRAPLAAALPVRYAYPADRPGNHLTRGSLGYGRHHLPPFLPRALQCLPASV